LTLPVLLATSACTVHTVAYRSRPGHTVFTLLIPVRDHEEVNGDG